MGRSRYNITQQDVPHFLTCTILGWIPLFTRQETVDNNPVKRGYVDLPEHWRYSSARNYIDKEGLIPVYTAWWTG